MSLGGHVRHAYALRGYALRGYALRGYALRVLFSSVIFLPISHLSMWVLASRYRHIRSHALAPSTPAPSCVPTLKPLPVPTPSLECGYIR